MKLSVLSVLFGSKLTIAHLVSSQTTESLKQEKLGQTSIPFADKQSL